MKKILAVTVLLVQTSTICFAETFFWEDKKGIHITEDISKLPPKFREKYDKYAKQNPKQELKVEKVIPESAKNAVKALKKLEALYQAGISYDKYTPALGDAKYEVNMFLESKESNDFENLKLSITRAMNHYINIRKIWEFLTSDGYEYSTYDLSSPFALYFLKMYPEANKEMSKGGVITDNRNSIYYGEALHYAFTEASKELANSFGKYSSKPLTGQH